MVVKASKSMICYTNPHTRADFFIRLRILNNNPPKYDIFFNMDYSRYYLKNYFRHRHDEDYESREDYEVIDETVEETSRSEYSQSDEETPKAHKYYARGVEIEVVPQLTSMVDTNYDISDDDVIVDVQARPYDRRDSRRKGLVITLAIVACLLLTVVIGDYASDGALLDGISSLYGTQAMPSSGYYMLVYKSTDSYQQARLYSDRMRLQGGGGYILKSGSEYLLIADVYDDLDEASAVKEKNEGSTLLSYNVKAVDYSNLLAGSSELMQSMGGYSASIVAQLSNIGENLTKLEIDKSRALEEISELEGNLRLKYDELSKEDVSTNYYVKLLMADIDVTLGLLENLLGESVSRPNLVCDIRYVKVQIVLNYYTLTEKMSQED